MPESTATNTQTTALTEKPTGIAALGINPVWFGFQLLNFLIVLAIFWKWVYGPIVKKLDERAETIEKGIKQSKEIEERVAKLEKERAEVIGQAKAEATKILESAKNDGDVRRTEMVAKAKEEVARVVKDGKAQLANEKEAMKASLKKDIAELAVEVARKVLAESVNEKTSHAMAEQAVDEMTKV